MTKKNQDIEDYWSGDTLNINVSVTDSDGNNKDLTNAEGTWILSSNPGGSAIVTKTISGGGITIDDAVNGELTIHVDPEDTESLSGSHHHELEIIDDTDDTSTVLVGEFNIEVDTV